MIIHEIINFSLFTFNYSLLLWQLRILNSESISERRHGRPEIYDSPDHIGEYDHIRDELFIEDKTHFTPEGYELYRQFMLKALEPVL